MLAYRLPFVKRHSVPFGLWEEVGVGAGLTLGERPVANNLASCFLLLAYCLYLACGQFQGGMLY